MSPSTHMPGSPDSKEVGDADIANGIHRARDDLMSDLGPSQAQYPDYPEHQQIQQLAFETPPREVNDSMQLVSGGREGKNCRLRKACDSCSVRKVKCDEAGPPCRACASLEIPCTFSRPSRRRGPPNRHAEALKRQRVDDGSYSSPPSPNNIAATLASLSSHAVLNAESICPLPILEHLVDDFFTYIHPLVPFPHEPSFRDAFLQREDLRNPNFLALLASMIGALVASFPRRPMMHLKKFQQEHLFPNVTTMVDRCHRVAVEARGAGYLDKNLSVYDAATSYLLALAAAYTHRFVQSRLYMAETLSISRTLGVHKDEKQAYGEEIQTPAVAVDCIKQEIGRRIFWVLYVSLGSMSQLGINHPELYIYPQTRSELYPPFPVEVDDEFIFIDHIEPQPIGVLARVVGFNLNAKVFLTRSSLTTMDLAYGIDELYDWPRQKHILEQALDAAVHVLDSAPDRLFLDVGRRITKSAPLPIDSKRSIQYEIQKANIYVSWLGTRSYITEKFWNLLEANVRLAESATKANVDRPGPTRANENDIMSLTEDRLAKERQRIVDDLIQVLSSVSRENMEPNGSSVIMKIRQIALTLMDHARNRKRPLELGAQEYIDNFLAVLTKLEVTGPLAGTNWDDEEPSEWADLRDFQQKSNNTQQEDLIAPELN